MNPVIVPIVEGQGEVEAVPILLRRILHSWEAFACDIRRPIRVKRQRVVKPGELERVLELAAMQPGCRAVLLLLDAEEDCPAILGPALLERAQKARPDIPCRVVLAKAKYECWFVGSIESLRGQCGIRADAAAPDSPEEMKGAKAWLTQHMEHRRTYQEVDDQPPLTASFDIELAQRSCPSFDKLLRDLRDLQTLLSEEQ